MGEFFEIDDEVDWNLEMGAICMRASETGAPSPIFNKIKDSPDGFRSAEDTVSGLVENEYLHVFHGVYAGEPCPNPDEVGAYRWMLPDRVRRGLAARPDWFTPWFALLAAKHAPDYIEAGPANVKLRRFRTACPGG